MPATGRAIDISNYSGIPTVAQFQQAKAEGYGLVIVGTQNPKMGQAQLFKAVRAGLQLSAYVWLDWASDIEMQMRTCALMIKPFDIQVVWLDVEQDWAAFNEVVSKIRQAVDLCSGQAVGIYTSRSKWLSLTDNSTDFAILPLWDALYPHPDPDYFIPYGGWDRCQMRQHTPDAHVAGILCDLNVYRIVTI